MLTLFGFFIISVAASKKKVPVEAIAGGVIGAIVVLGAILGLVCWARPGRSNNRRLRRKAGNFTLVTFDNLVACGTLNRLCGCQYNRGRTLLYRLPLRAHSSKVMQPKL